LEEFLPVPSESRENLLSIKEYFKAISSEKEATREYAGSVARAFTQGEVDLSSGQEFRELFRDCLGNWVAFPLLNSLQRPIPVLLASEVEERLVQAETTIYEKTDTDELFEVFIQSEIPYVIARALLFYYSHFFPNLLR
jgi:hypothetical protein